MREFNTKKPNGEDYKEYVIKTMWNSTTKMLEEKYFSEDGFSDMMFKGRKRCMKCQKERVNNGNQKKRKRGSSALNKDNSIKMAKL